MTPDPDAHDDPRADLLDTVFELQRELAIAFQSSAAARWMELDLTMPQFKTLYVVALQGPLTVNALAEALGVTQSTVSHLVDRLENGGLVERVGDSGDRRRTFVRLSPEGAELFETLQRGRREYIRELLRRLDLADLAALVRGLSAIARAARGTLP